MQLPTALLAVASLLAASASASTLPLTSRDTYDRKGSGMCGSKTMQVKYCDEAVNNFLIRDDAYRYRPDVYNKCAGAGTTVTSGCHVSVEGDAACRRSGNQIWQDYQDLRRNGADKCGSKHWDQWEGGKKLACRTTVNYISDCMKGKDESCKA
ncbi:hypothetical protein PG993_007052 [Apiospora rasikravindrae]|uniref:Uncharacterized protein n=1 Tax=Apiospora rasikravindrae TaxID=990691 RepID=A0ABR1SWF8_9PEZI